MLSRFIRVGHKIVCARRVNQNINVRIRQNFKLIQTSAYKMNGEPPVKSSRKDIKIGTHNGVFHCDEALACFLLQQLPEYSEAKIIRSRDPAVLKECDIVVDVGAVFDPKIHRYDHHQRDFNESMNSLDPLAPWTIKLSSAGLIYFYFGKKIIAAMLDKSVESEETSVIFNKVYENFLQEIDAIDNGINQFEGDPKYLISTNISSRVGFLNPKWNEASNDADLRFQKAMKLVGSEFLDKVNYYKDVWWPARNIVKSAIEKRHEVDSSGVIIEFEEGGCPWKDHLFMLEEELKIKPEIKFVLYKDQNENWRVQSVPVQLGSFESRLPLLEEWRGLRDDQLSKTSGIPDCIFIHSTGFIGGNKTRDGVLTLARTTLQKAN